MKGYPPIDNNVINTQLQSAMRDLSRSKYAKPKAQVAAEVLESLSSTTTDVHAAATSTATMGSDKNLG